MMPYKDKEKQKEANRIASQKRRDKGMTQQGMTREGMTRIGFIQKQLNDTFLVEGIEGAIRVKDDRDLRYERAYIYKLKREGKVKGSIIGLSINELRAMSKIPESVGEYLEVTG